MTDKEKQLQEIEDILNDAYMTISSNLNERMKVSKLGLHRVYAEAFYNAGYSKVGVGYVVLSPEQRDDEMKEYNADRAEREEQVRKETAKEIFKKIALLIPAFGYEKLSEVEKRLVDGSDFYYKERIEEIFEEYGVEVEE